MKEDAQFYVGQKAFIRKGDEVLVLGDLKERLDYPGGKIQEGETDIIESLKREVREETGLEINVGKPFVTWTIIFPPQHRLEGKRLYLVGYSCEYVSGEVRLSNEHSTYQWISKEKYTSLVNTASYTKGDTSFLRILKEYFQEK